MKLTDVDVQFIFQTEAAYLVQSVDTGVKEWVPKSLCELDLKKDSDMGVLTLEEGLAINKRLI